LAPRLSDPACIPVNSIVIARLLSLILRLETVAREATEVNRLSNAVVGAHLARFIRTPEMQGTFVAMQPELIARLMAMLDAFAIAISHLDPFLPWVNSELLRFLNHESP
jgi:hypothetical protein